MAGLAVILFIGLFAFGDQLMGWRDPDGQISLALFMSFLFGIIAAYRARG
jgi:hypothetical protein